MDLATARATLREVAPHDLTPTAQDALAVVLAELAAAERRADQLYDLATYVLGRDRGARGARVKARAAENGETVLALVTRALESELAHGAKACGARGFAGGNGCVRRKGHDGRHGYADGSGEHDD